ncbi:transcription factor MYB88-like isoform X2 [Salvia splendens]|uniref:transcription factor MYB88-like isoform X2 n=1 Tax=Salvia splendens TaxID=180675 RepID=UPI001C25F794|nr:transcription factor MYB88-like isoform X2 [Salvia splendens]
MKKKVNSGSDANNGDASKQKERHIVSWSQEEDDILREQIRLHGTENWAIIASKFKDKTTRQCRRRWFTYLNSDFKKGGWSPEEDVLLCEAQKIFGNRWTEIAKVVSGRTDNAVKNRFTTLCKKRAKHEALAKENSTSSYINLNNKRVIFPNGLNAGGSESAAPLKNMRVYVLNTAESHGENLSGECAGINKSQGTFLKKDDPKVLALMQQAELLSSLAIKVNSEKTDQSLESAWMALQDFLKQNKESDLFTLTNPDVDFQLEKFKDLVEDLTNDDEGSRPSWREPDLYESSTASSEYSAGSTLLPIMPGDKVDENQDEICLLHQENGHRMQPDQLDHQQCLAESSRICQTASTDEVNMLTCNNTNDNDEAVCEYSSTEFGSPLHVTPLFGALAATIPSPKFSESEKHFLMKALGMDSTSPSHVANASQPPPCKRSLLHCL